jgi:hypothetical protein
MRMRLLCNSEYQFERLVETRLHGEKAADFLFDRKVEAVEKKRLYEEYTRILRESYMPDHKMMSFEEFALHSTRAMEYAKFCQQQFLLHGREFIKRCGGETSSFYRFDISRCREIAASAGSQGEIAAAAPGSSPK